MSETTFNATTVAGNPRPNSTTIAMMNASPIVIKSGRERFEKGNFDSESFLHVALKILA